MLYPLKLTGVIRSPIWSGSRLVRDWNKKGAERIGESWELTVRADGDSTVVGGELDGALLSELLKQYPEEIMGKSAHKDGFPLLIKLLDAGDDLSVQVHPNDAYAARVENDRGKTEMWYVVEADEGAEIICGLRKGTTKEMLRRAIAEGNVLSVLDKKRVKSGECYFIPAGLPHAIGRGILIAEIQQNCDLTYRVYDYDRRDQNGNLRELHVEKALDVIRPFTEEEIDRVRFAKAPRTNAETLADCAYFRVEEIKTKDLARTLSLHGRMGHLLCVGGAGALAYNGQKYAIARGEGYLLPACLDSVTLSGEGTFLFTLAK